jgi:hypothetical protein
MALNVTPGLNRFRHVRYGHSNGVDYETLMLEDPANWMTASQYCQLEDAYNQAKVAQVLTLASSLVAQFALGRWSAFKKLGGYLRTGTRAGLVVLPYFYLRQTLVKDVKDMHHDLVMQKLEATYSKPLSHQYMVR